MNIVRIHHLNCGTMRFRFGRQFDGHRSLFDSSLVVVNHCLLIETASWGLVVVDTGYGMQQHVNNPQNIPWSGRFATRPALVAEETIMGYLKKLGFTIRDVRHIVFTHLDHDHVGGLNDLPDALAHVYEPEWQQAISVKSRKDRFRYRPTELNMHSHWQYVSAFGGDTWYGLRGVQPIKGFQGEIALVPLPGHSVGHCGVAITTQQGWLLHAGDAYMIQDEMEPAPYGDESTGIFTRIIQVDDTQRRKTLETLRMLRSTHSDEIDLFCAHDKPEFDRFIQRPDAGPLTTKKAAKLVS